MSGSILPGVMRRPFDAFLRSSWVPVGAMFHVKHDKALPLPVFVYSARRPKTSIGAFSNLSFEFLSPSAYNLSNTSFIPVYEVEP